LPYAWFGFEHHRRGRCTPDRFYAPVRFEANPVPADRRSPAVLPVLLEPDGRALVVEHRARVDRVPRRVGEGVFVVFGLVAEPACLRLVAGRYWIEVCVVSGNAVAEPDGLRLVAGCYFRGHGVGLLSIPAAHGEEPTGRTRDARRSGRLGMLGPTNRAGDLHRYRL
jgi:hypothetical protein